MRDRTRLIIALGLASLIIGPAMADLTYTQGSGTTIFDFVCFSTKHCSAHVPVNSAGTEIGTSAAPIQVTLANTGANSTAVKTDASATTQPISGTITANAGTNLNTSLLALEGGGNIASLVTQIGAVTASPTANTMADRLKTINTTLGSPFQAGGALAANQTVNLNQYAGNAITCTMTAYGTAPTGNCPGFNAYVTNSTVALVANADGITPAASGLNSPVNNYNYVYNGATFDRMRSGTQTGSVAVASADPCLGANKTNLAISQSGTSSVQLVALSGSTVIYVCSLSLIAAGATTAVLTTGTGTACVTGNAAVLGDTTANIANGLSFAANGGLTLGNGAGTIMKGAASSELCMTLGTNVRMSGNLTYIQQ